MAPEPEDRTCATCKYWNAYGEWGTCQFVIHYEATAADEPFSKRAKTRDSEQYHSTLETRGDFGCVEHEVVRSGAVEVNANKGEDT